MEEREGGDMREGDGMVSLGACKVHDYAVGVHTVVYENRPEKHLI